MCSVTSGQSYKHFTIVNYDSRLENTPYYDPRVVIYDRKMFIRLATDVKIKKSSNFPEFARKEQITTFLVKHYVLKAQKGTKYLGNFCATICHQ